MAQPGTVQTVDYAALDDLRLAALIAARDRDAFCHLMQRCNQRLFRTARGMVGNDAEAEDIVQDGYLRAFEHIATFRGESSLTTWLTRIVINGAQSRLRQRRTTVEFDQIETLQTDGDRVVPFPSRFGNEAMGFEAPGSEDPAAAASRQQVGRLIEHAVDDLPEPFRIVFVLRDIEGCSVEETASSLELRTETVKTRLHRARRLLRAALNDTLSATLSDAFPFLGPRCARITAAVMARIDETDQSHTSR